MYQDIEEKLLWLQIDISNATSLNQLDILADYVMMYRELEEELINASQFECGEVYGF